MAYYKIEGGYQLNGEIVTQGAKNEALQVISAVLLTDEKVTISNVPDIIDVNNLIKLLANLGVEVNSPQEGVYEFKAENIDSTILISKIL